MISLYLSIPAMIPKVFNFASKLTIPIETPSNEEKAEIETQTLTAETKTTKC